MDRTCNCLNPSNVNCKYDYKGKYRENCLIYGVKCTMCDAIYIVKKQKKFKRRMNGHLSDIQIILILICCSLRATL